MDTLPYAFVPAIVLIILAIYIFASAVRVLREYERGVIFRLGRLSKALFNPGGKGMTCLPQASFSGPRF